MTAYIGLGSNLGDREKNLRGAVAAIDSLPCTHVLRISSWLENPAVGIPDGPDFLNGVAEIETSLTPHELLVHLQEIEQRFGRIRQAQTPPSRPRSSPPGPTAKAYENRTLDLDILLYGDEEIHEVDLVIPHPRMREREFVMKPLGELRGV